LIEGAREEERERERSVPRGERQPGVHQSLEELHDLGSEDCDVVKSELRTKKDPHFALQVLRYVGTRHAQREAQGLTAEQLVDKYRLVAAAQLGLVALQRNRVLLRQLAPAEEFNVGADQTQGTPPN
jgi:hypothetical protein